MPGRAALMQQRHQWWGLELQQGPCQGLLGSQRRHWALQAGHPHRFHSPVGTGLFSSHDAGVHACVLQQVYSNSCSCSRVHAMGGCLQWQRQHRHESRRRLHSQRCPAAQLQDHWWPLADQPVMQPQRLGNRLRLVCPWKLLCPTDPCQVLSLALHSSMSGGRSMVVVHHNRRV